MRDATVTNPKFQTVALRYFNPIGAHKSGLIGEDPKEIPNNLAPYITQVASGKLGQLSIFGNDYETPDGTGIRDYIHVMDVADGHVSALKIQKPGFHAINLGSGKGTSVLELLNLFKSATGIEINHAFAPRRMGDIAEFYADTKLASQIMNWKTSRSLEEACRDAWNWQVKNPNGY